ncbi:MAG: hypothetical protein R2844_08230 [Caldilineales bacterium]
MAVNLIGIAASLGMSCPLLPRIGMAGALTASAASQWLMLVIYVVWGRRLRQSGMQAMQPASVAE